MRGTTLGLRKISNRLTKAKAFACKLAHVAFGLLTAYVFTVIPMGGLSLVLLFLTYEVVEKSVVKDLGYPEIREFTVSLAVGLLIFTTIV